MLGNWETLTYLQLYFFYAFFYNVNIHGFVLSFYQKSDDFNFYKVLSYLIKGFEVTWNEGLSVLFWSPVVRRPSVRLLTFIFFLWNHWT